MGLKGDMYWTKQESVWPKKNIDQCFLKKAYSRVKKKKERRRVTNQILTTLKETRCDWTNNFGRVEIIYFLEISLL